MEAKQFFLFVLACTVVVFSTFCVFAYTHQTAPAGVRHFQTVPSSLLYIPLESGGSEEGEETEDDSWLDDSLEDGEAEPMDEDETESNQGEFELIPDDEEEEVPDGGRPRQSRGFETDAEILADIRELLQVLLHVILLCISAAVVYLIYRIVYPLFVSF